MSTQNEASHVDAAVHGGPTPHERPWLMVTVLSIIYTSAFVDRNVLALIVDPIKTDLKLSDTQVSLLLGLAFSLFYALSTLPAGLLIDRIGRRGIIAASVSLWSVFTIGCGLVVSFGQFFLGRAGVGLSEAFVTPTSFALIRDRLPATQRGRAFSVLGLAPSIGGALAFACGGGLLHAAAAGRFASWPVIGSLHPWQATLMIVGLAGMPLPLLLLLIRRDVRPTLAQQPLSPMADLRELSTELALKLRTYVLIVLYATAGSMAVFGFVAWFPAMISRKFHLSPAQTGLTSGPIFLFGSIAGMAVCGYVLDWLTRRRRSVLLYALVANGAFALSSGFTPLTSNLKTAWGLLAVTMFFAGSFYSIGATVLAQVTPARVMGKITVSYLLLANVVGGGLGPTLVALLSDKVLRGPAALQHALSFYCASTSLIAWVVALVLLCTQPQHTPDAVD